jgi:hypothetical protein
VFRINSYSFYFTSIFKQNGDALPQTAMPCLKRRCLASDDDALPQTAMPCLKRRCLASDGDALPQTAMPCLKQACIYFFILSFSHNNYGYCYTLQSAEGPQLLEQQVQIKFPLI